jgi:hypothetical protein
MILVIAVELEYLFVIWVVGVFFKPTYQSVPAVRDVSVPVVAAGADDVFEF